MLRVDAFELMQSVSNDPDEVDSGPYRDTIIYCWIDNEDKDHMAAYRWVDPNLNVYV